MTKLAAYFCGGAGINNGKVFAKWSGKANPGFATLQTAYIDTSDRNKTEEIPDSMFYAVRNMDDTDNLRGGGKVRRTNVEPIENAVNEVIHNFPPGETSVVVHSLSGASGSVIGPLLARELTSRGHDVIILAIGSTGSTIEISNTINSLVTYQNFVEMLEKPFNILYRENSLETPRDKVNYEIESAVTILSAMFSGQNEELDQEDGHVFLNYNLATDQEPILGFFDLFAGEVELKKGDHLASLLSLTDDQKQYEYPGIVEYHTTGFINPTAVKAMKQRPMPLQAAIISGRFHHIDLMLKKKLSECEAQRNLVVNKTFSGTKKSVTTGKGLAL